MLSFDCSLNMMILTDIAKIQGRNKEKKMVEKGKKFVSGKTMMPKEA